MNKFRAIQKICQDIPEPAQAISSELDLTQAYQQGQYDLAQKILKLVFQAIKDGR